MEERSPPVVPPRDPTFGQSDRVTGYALRALIGIACLAAGGMAVVASWVVADALGRAASWLVMALGSPIAVVGTGALLLRFLAADRRAAYARIAQRVKWKNPWARIRVASPPFRVLGVPILHGRPGVVALTPERAVVVARRFPIWSVAGCAAGALLSGGQSASVEALLIPTALAFLAALLSLLTGADVYEIDYRDLDVVDAGEGHVNWGQSGDDAPRALRFRLTNLDDPACVSPRLGGPGPEIVADDR